MSEQLKHRIIGTLVLTALAVIFLPNLLDGEKRRLEENFATIPLRPVALPQPVPEQALEETIVVAPTPEPKPSAPQTTKAQPKGDTADKPATKADSKPKPLKSGWTLQVGSFKNAKNVTKLVKELRAQGFRAYSIPTRPVEGRMNRVFIGPDVSRERLQKEQVRLAKATDLKGALVPYKATDI